MGDKRTAVDGGNTGGKLVSPQGTRPASTRDQYRRTHTPGAGLLTGGYAVSGLQGKARRLDAVSAVTAHTAEVCERFGTIPQDTREYHSRDESIQAGYVAGVSGIGLYAEPARDRATGESSDPYGRTSRTHDRQVRRLLRDAPLSDTIDSILARITKA